MTRDTTRLNGGMFDIAFMLKNIAVGFALSIALLFIASVITALACMPEVIINLIVAVVTYLSVGICGFRAARKAGRNGLLSGAVSGIVYSAVLYIIACIVFGKIGFSASSAATFGLCLMSGAIGGLVGINTRPKRRK